MNGPDAGEILRLCVNGNHAWLGPGTETDGLMLHVLYLVHDLADPAVRRRVLTLQAGGARVTLAGFRRDDNALAAVHGTVPIELGRTHDARFAQRIGAIIAAAMRLKHTLRGVDRPDVIIARNLEMLAVGNRANAVFGGDVPLAYECLDIHRLLLRRDAAGTAIRAIERRLGGAARLLLTSSPAFVDNYFRRLSSLDLPIMLLENKVLALDGDHKNQPPTARPPRDGEPWKIGWFGALRCRKSLQVLSEFSRRMEGRYEIVLRGRPAYSEFEDFDGFVRDEPFLTYHGPYKNPEDLASIYGDVQFSWAIDLFEEGQNSSWLLPNRLYEGGLYGAVPIAAAGTETARFLANRKMGVVLKQPAAADLCEAFGAMTKQRYLDAFAAVSAHDRRSWITDRSDCKALVLRLASTARGARNEEPAPTLSQPHHNKGGL